MIISDLKLTDFRQFDYNSGLHITFHKGLNALVGENDSGKTAVIDAIKLVLLTQSNEYIRPVDEDFHRYDDGTVALEFRIDCTITDLSPNEMKNFIEYLTGDRDNPTFQLHYRAWREGHKIFQELRAGNVDDGVQVDGKARDLLKVVYLKPLRDAEREMSSGRSSRISQILLSHFAFRGTEKHPVLEIMEKANNEINGYFKDDEKGKQILQTICNNLNAFNDRHQSIEARLETSDIRLKAILESLSLNVSEINPGLGELNLLFMAAELLLLKDDTDGGIRLALIEELEAHLHPQAQLRLISYLQNVYCENDVQIIISTHSPVLASKINIKNLILMKNHNGYDLDYSSTKLERNDYLFLQRFLDSTKANLFFAKGIIMVEGDAENILIPVIADIIGYPLEKYGISVVNVGSTAFLRYSRIMIRSDGSSIGIPVSVVTDCDVKPCCDSDPETTEKKFDEKTGESDEAVAKKKEKYTVGSVKGFVSPRWTFEYCIAMSCLSKDFHRAVNYGKKIFNAQDSISLTKDKISKADNAFDSEMEQWKDLSPGEKAFNIYSLMLNSDGSSSMKTIVAQCLASLLRWNTSVIQDGITEEMMFDLDLYRLRPDTSKKDELKKLIEMDPYLGYIVEAIKYAAGVYEQE